MLFGESERRLYARCPGIITTHTHVKTIEINQQSFVVSELMAVPGLAKLILPVGRHAEMKITAYYKLVELEAPAIATQTVVARKNIGGVHISYWQTPRSKLRGSFAVRIVLMRASPLPTDGIN